MAVALADWQIGAKNLGASRRRRYVAGRYTVVASLEDGCWHVLDPLGAHVVSARTRDRADEMAACLTVAFWLAYDSRDY